jgi:hypothetical protein
MTAATPISHSGPNGASDFHRPHRATDAQDRKEPAALFGRVDICRKTPELRNGRHIEDAHPEKERDADDDVRPSEDREDDQIRGEEEVHGRDEPLPPHAAGESAVGADDHDEQQRLPTGGVLLHFGPAVQKNERLARRLKKVIAGQKQKDGERQQRRRDRLSFLHLREGTQDTRQAALEQICGRGGAHWA